MSPTPAPRVVAGGVASSFRNRSTIERCRYRSASSPRSKTAFSTALHGVGIHLRPFPSHGMPEASTGSL
jgi:hypothetical protein